MTCALLSRTLLKIAVKVTGTKGSMKVFNPTAQFHHRLTLRAGSGVTRETFGRKPTYTYQLEAFTAAVLRGEPTLTPPFDAVANMRAIDAVYRAAGLRLRGSAS